MGRQRLIILSDIALIFFPDGIPLAFTGQGDPLCMPLYDGTGFSKFYMDIMKRFMR